MSDEARGNVYCPKCAIPTQVIDTRGTADNEVRRRRRCADCGERFTTYEAIYRRDADNRKRARKLLSQLADMLGVD